MIIYTDYLCENGVPYRNYYGDADCTDLLYSYDIDSSDTEYDYIHCSGGCKEYIKIRDYWDVDGCTDDNGYT